MTMRRASLILVFLASSAVARADQATDDAKKRFEQGNVHYNLGEYKEALAQYKEAYRLKKLPGFLFNIAQCHRKLGDYQQAINLYNAYLTEVPKAPNRADVESLITESREKLAAQETSDAEKRRVEEAEAHRQAEEERHKAEEERRRAEEARARSLTAQKTDTPEERHPARLWALVGMGTGALALVGGGIFAARAVSAQSAFEDAACGDPDAPLGANEIDECQDQKTKGEQSALLANVLLGGGLVVAGTSLVVFLVDPGHVSGPTQGASLSLTPTSVRLRVDF